MSNKTSDKNVVNIEKLNKFLEPYKQIKEYASIVANVDKDFFFESVDLLLAEREQMLKEREKYTIRLTDEEYRKVIENAQRDTSNDTVIAHKFAVMQQQIEQKDKRIQELEELKEALFRNYQEQKLQKEEQALNIKEVLKQNYIPKQVVIDELKRLNAMLGRTTEGRIQKYTVNEIIIRSNTLQELLEGERK